MQRPKKKKKYAETKTFMHEETRDILVSQPKAQEVHTQYRGGNHRWTEF